MNPKVFLLLAAITVATTVAAVFAVLSQPTATTLQLVDEPAFPALRENPDAVAKIVLSSPEGTITLVRETGERWAALERHGYPVDRKRVRDLVVALSDMSLIERKTAQPEHYDRLEVEAIDAQNAQSELVRLEGADGTVLAEAIIGKQRYRLTGTEPSGTYLRRPDEAQSWLASGGIQIDREVARWLEGEIVDLDPEAIRRIEIQRAGEPSYAAVRDKPGDELRLADLGQDESVKEDADFARLTGAFSSVQLEDVKPRDQLSWPSESGLAEVETFDGLRLTVRLAKIDDQYWATFDARAVRPATGAAAEPDDPATSGSDAGSEPAPASAPPAAATDDEASPAGQTEAEAVDDEAGAEGLEEVSLDEADAPPDPAQLGQRLGKWAYQVPEHFYNRLTTGRSEFLGDQDSTS